MNQGVRPNKLWHWAALAVLAATFLAEPKAFLAVTKDLFTGAGQVGGALITNDGDQPTQPYDTAPDADTRTPADEFGPPTDTSFTPPASVAGECTQNVFDCCPTVERHIDNLPHCLAIAFNTDHPTTDDDEAAIGGVIDARLIRSTLDRGADMVLGLHTRVEQARDEGLYIAVDPNALNPPEGPDR